MEYQNNVVHCEILTHDEEGIGKIIKSEAVFKISAGPQALDCKTGVSLASFPSLLYINFGKIVLRSSKFQILFWGVFFKPEGFFLIS